MNRFLLIVVAAVLAIALMAPIAQSDATHPDFQHCYGNTAFHSFVSGGTWSHRSWFIGKSADEVYDLYRHDHYKLVGGFWVFQHGQVDRWKRTLGPCSFGWITN